MLWFALACAPEPEPEPQPVEPSLTFAPVDVPILLCEQSTAFTIDVVGIEAPVVEWRLRTRSGFDSLTHVEGSSWALHVPNAILASACPSGIRCTLWATTLDDPIVTDGVVLQVADIDARYTLDGGFVPSGIVPIDGQVLEATLDLGGFRPAPSEVTARSAGGATVPMSGSGTTWSIPVTDLNICDDLVLAGQGGIAFSAGFPACSSHALPGILDTRFVVEDCDGDGIATAIDCDDFDADPEWSMGFPHYPDADGDGFGDASAVATTLCQQDLSGTLLVDQNLDCDDTNAAVHPYAMEDLNTPIDDNCDGSAACGLDCDGPPELLFADASGLTFIDGDPFVFSDAVSTPLRAAALPLAMAAVDLDGNGHVDVVIRTDNETSIEFDVHDPAGGRSVLPDFGGGEVRVGDFDLDGIGDLLLGSSSGAAVLWGGAIQPSTTFGLAPGELVQYADFDQDGCQDLVVAGFEDAGSHSTTGHIYFGTPDGVTCSRAFTEVSFPLDGPRELAIGDLDGVGGPDLAIAMASTGTTAAPAPSPISLLIEVDPSRQLTQIPVAVEGAYQVAISQEGRVAFAAGSTAGLGVHLFDATTFAPGAVLPGGDITEVLWFEFGTGGADLVVTTAGSTEPNRVFLDGDAGQMIELSLDMPTTGASVVHFTHVAGNPWGLITTRAPGSGDFSAVWSFNGTGFDEHAITATSSVAPLALFAETEPTSHRH